MRPIEWQSAGMKHHNEPQGGFPFPIADEAALREADAKARERIPASERMGCSMCSGRRYAAEHNSRGKTQFRYHLPCLECEGQGVVWGRAGCVPVLQVSELLPDRFPKPDASVSEHPPW